MVFGVLESTEGEKRLRLRPHSSGLVPTANQGLCLFARRSPSNLITFYWWATWEKRRSAGERKG